MLSAPMAWPAERKYWCYYHHRTRDSVSPVYGIFNRPGVAGDVQQTALGLINSFYYQRGLLRLVLEESNQILEVCKHQQYILRLEVSRPMGSWFSAMAITNTHTTDRHHNLETELAQSAHSVKTLIMFYKNLTKNIELNRKSCKCFQNTPPNLFLSRHSRETKVLSD